MPWGRLDDSFDAHRKVRRAGLEATGLHARALSYSAGALTDGHIDPEWVQERAGSRGAKLAELLVTAGLWEPNGDGWAIHDYLDFNFSREEVESKRGWDAKRKTLFQDRELVAAIRARDQDHCRYCGREVNWNDRKGKRGGTYDHVQPRGDNTLENVVVACRECNTRKGARTPDQAQMPLSPIQTGPRS